MALFSEINDRVDHTKHTFIDLPAELRQRVYQNLLLSACDGNIEFWNVERTSKRGWQWSQVGTKDLQTDILRVCKLVHREATAVMYGENGFQTSEAPSGVPNGFLIHCIGSNIELIRHLQYQGSLDSGAPTGFVQRVSAMLVTMSAEWKACETSSLIMSVSHQSCVDTSFQVQMLSSASTRTEATISCNA